MSRIEKVDKKLVHKHNKENVLIFNLRRFLPKNIPSANLQKKYFEILNDKEKEIIKKYYSKEQFSFKKNKIKSDDLFYLHGLPFSIKFEMFYEYMKKRNLSLKNIKLFLTCYNRDKLNKTFYLKDDINDEDEIILVKALNLKEWHINDKEKTLLSDVLEKNPDIEKINVFFANMLVDINHSFFFEHSNEHVPSMMVLEASRQFLIAICHKYFNVPYEKVNFVLSTMDVKYLDYLELNYPIKFKAVVNTVKFRWGYSNFIDLTIETFQNHKSKVIFSYTGRAVSNDVFNKLRNDKKDSLVMPRFIPYDILHYSIILKDEKNAKFRGRLFDISINGFCLGIDKEFGEDLKQFDKYEFFLHFQDVGFIHGHCSKVWKTLTDENFKCGFKISSIDKLDQEYLNIALKRFCFVNEDREIY